MTSLSTIAAIAAVSASTAFPSGNAGVLDEIFPRVPEEMY